MVKGEGEERRRERVSRAGDRQQGTEKPRRVEREKKEDGDAEEDKG